MVTRYNSITTNKTFIELGKIKIYTEDDNTDEQKHEINALLESPLVVQLPFWYNQQKCDFANAKFDSCKLLNQLVYEKCVFILHSPTVL